MSPKHTFAALGAATSRAYQKTRFALAQFLRRSSRERREIALFGEKHRRKISIEIVKRWSKITQCVGSRAHWRHCCRFSWSRPRLPPRFVTCRVGYTKRIPTVAQLAPVQKPQRQPCRCLPPWT